MPIRQGLGTPSAIRTLGPRRIYALKWQTIAFEADAGECSYIFNGQTTEPIAFDAEASEYEEAFELLSSVGEGKVSAYGDPGNIHFVFDQSIIPTLITTGTNDLEFEAAPVVPTIEVTSHAAYLDVELYTPQVGERIIDFSVDLIEPFQAATISLADAPLSAGAWTSGSIGLTLADDLGDNFTGSSEGTGARSALRLPDTPGVLPTRCKISTPLYASISIDPGNAGGIVDVFLVVAQSAPFPS